MHHLIKYNINIQNIGMHYKGRIYFFNLQFFSWVPIYPIQLNPLLNGLLWFGFGRKIIDQTQIILIGLITSLMEPYPTLLYP